MSGVWQPRATAPTDGTHIIVRCGPYSSTWTYLQSPPCVVHYWGHPGEEGFYLSSGLVEGSHNDVPQAFLEWRHIDADLGVP